MLVAFQSQGRFFGGAAKCKLSGPLLFGSFNRRGDSLGVLHGTGPTGGRPILVFQSQGRFFGGAACPMNVQLDYLELFQSQGRFFGGAA